MITYGILQNLNIKVNNKPMNREQTLHQLIELGLHGMAEGYEAIIKLPINKQPKVT